MKTFKIKLSRKTILFIAIALIAALLFVFFNAADWRELYCQANPINCIRKGW